MMDMSFNWSKNLTAMALASALAFVSIFGSTLPASAAAPSPVAAVAEAGDWLTTTQATYEQLEAKLPGSWQRKKSKDLETYQYKRLTSEGEVAMTMVVRVAQNDIFVETIKVESRRFKGRGYSILMFAKMLLDFPETRRVSGQMEWDNKAAMGALGNPESFAVASFSAQTKAAKATPFYKALSQFGFTELDRTSGGYGHFVYLSLSRPLTRRTP